VAVIGHGGQVMVSISCDGYVCYLLYFLLPPDTRRLYTPWIVATRSCFKVRRYVSKYVFLLIASFQRSLHFDPAAGAMK
jgi:hypothetical protein